MYSPISSYFYVYCTHVLGNEWNVLEADHAIGFHLWGGASGAGVERSQTAAEMARVKASLMQM